MIVRLSTKGQLVIPRRFREQLGLEAGTQFEVQVKTDQIILTPLTHHSPLAELYGKYKGTNLLDALEADHKQELNQENSIKSVPVGDVPLPYHGYIRFYTYVCRLV